ncbi:MAG: hypothetical protein ACKVP4_13715 [Hyphomicrobium sp.]
MVGSTYVLRLLIVGALAATALGYGGAVALDGIGLTASRNEGAAQVARPGDPNSATVPIREAADRTANFSAAAQRAYGGAEPVETGALGPSKASGDQSGGPAAAEPALDDAAIELNFERINLGGGLLKAGSMTRPMPTPSVARADPNLLQKVELLDPAPPSQTLQVPEERVIEIGPRKSPAISAANGVSDLTPDLSEQAKKPRKTAKAKKRKSDDSFAGSVQSFFGFE